LEDSGNIPDREMEIDAERTDVAYRGVNAQFDS
jgi:hypothetical protein